MVKVFFLLLSFQKTNAWAGSIPDQAILNRKRLPRQPLIILKPDLGNPEYTVQPLNYTYIQIGIKECNNDQPHGFEDNFPEGPVSWNGIEPSLDGAPTLSNVFKLHFEFI